MPDENAIIYIASKPVFFPGTTISAGGKEHLYLVYDRDGDGDIDDQTVIRGGPNVEEGGPTGNLRLENSMDLIDSWDSLAPANAIYGLTTASRNYTPLAIPGGHTAYSLWETLKQDVDEIAVGSPDGDDRLGSAVTYGTLGYDPGGVIGYLATQFDVVSGNNSNSLIASLLAEVGVNIYDVLPLPDSAGETRMDADTFTGVHDLFVAGDETETWTIDDTRINSVTDYGTGNTTLVVDGSQWDDENLDTLTLIADASSGSTDTIDLTNVAAADVGVVRTSSRDLQIVLPGDDFAMALHRRPSIVLEGQFVDDHTFNGIKIGGVNHSIANASDFPVNRLMRPDGSGGWVGFDAGTYKVVETWTSTTEVTVTWNTASLFTLDLSAETVTFASGLEIDDLDVDPGLVLEVPDLAETPMEAALDYLDQLGVEMTAEELALAEYNDNSPTGTPYTHAGSVDQTSSSSADYHFNSPSGPNATITGPAQVTIQTGVDGLGNPIYGQVVPDTITLYASDDLSRDTISNVNVLDVTGSVRLTAAQFAQFDLITGVGQSGPAFSIVAATGGTFDASAETFGAPLAGLTATSWSGTTLIGNDDDEQVLQASLLGNDTLIAGGGNDTVLIAGGGKNTLTGSSAGGTTFKVGGGLGDPPSVLAPDSTVTGSGSGNVLEVNGDISGATITGVQTLDVKTNITLTAAQFSAFTTVTGNGYLHAVDGGTYDWSESYSVFWDSYAESSEGTTIIGRGDEDPVTLHASESGDDTLILASGGGTIDARNSTGDLTLTAVDGGIIYAGLGVNTITMGEGDGNTVIASNGLASGSSITSGNDTTSQLTANGDISGATISGIYRLVTETGVMLNPTQLAEFNSLMLWSDQIIIAASAGTYSLAGKTLTGSGGTITLIGSSGADTLTGRGIGDLIYGGAGNDTISGGTLTSDDILAGGDGDDTITGGHGVDTISGDSGNDIIKIFSGHVPSGEIIDGGDGTDRLTVGDSGMTPLATLFNMEELYLNSGVTAINLTAAQLDDFATITHQSGGSQAFSITAQAAGTYSLAGKTITGIPTLIGSSGADTLTGNSGNDILRGMAGADTINGGDGDDTIQIFSGEVPSGESIDGGNGTDRLVVGNNNMNPSSMAVANMEELYLNSVATNLTVSASQLADFETITHQNGGGQAFTLNAASAGTYSLSGKTITGVATLNGTSGADTLTGSSGNDTINGNNGDDTIEGGAGDDTLNGGGDTDTLTYASAGSAVTVDLSNASAQNTGGAGTDTISNFENLTGSAYGDNLTGTSSANILQGGDGNDTISAGAGADTIDGGVGANTLDGGTGDDTYLLERTYGASEITDNDSTVGNSDTLQLGDDIARDQMWFRQSGNDLLVNVIGADAQMTIKDWYLGSDHQVEQIVTEEEDVLDHTAVQNLVSAMSSLTMPGTTTLSPEYHAQLDTVIAANWA